MVTTSDAPSLPPSFAGRRFDALGGAARPVRFTIDAGDLVLEPEGGGPVERHAVARTRVAERLTHAPRALGLPDGSFLQAEETAGLAAALIHAGASEPLVVRWQRAWPASLAALVVLLAGAAWLYFDGMPRLADWGANHVSPSLEAHMGDQALRALDRATLRPSTLDADQRAKVTRRIGAFEQAAGLAPARRIEFRSTTSGPGINAFALPGGVIVLLDGIVAMTADDDETLLAVYAHEAGHQQMHHMTRALFRGLGAGALAGMLWGDYSSVASHAALLFGVLRYSRDDEGEADDFAIAALRRAHISPGAVARFFWKLDAEEKKRGGGSVPGMTWLSTHPGTPGRAEKALEAAEVDRDAAASAARR